MNLLVKKCDWKEFVKEHKGVYTWFSGTEFNEWNPFDDFDDEILYITNARDEEWKIIIKELDEINQDTMLYIPHITSK